MEGGGRGEGEVREGESTLLGPQSLQSHLPLPSFQDALLQSYRDPSTWPLYLHRRETFMYMSKSRTTTP